jgi:hypothetical protein
MVSARVLVHPKAFTRSRMKEPLGVKLHNQMVVGAEGGPLFIACINHNLIYYPYALFI